MDYINWESKLEVGEAELDRQHRALVELANRLHRAMEANAPQRIGEVFEQFIERLESHFAFEDRLLERSRYPYLTAHRRVHQDLIRRLVRHQLALAMGVKITHRLLAELRVDLLNHILLPDLRLALVSHDFVTQRRAQLPTNQMPHPAVGRLASVSI